MINLQLPKQMARLTAVLHPLFCEQEEPSCVPGLSTPGSCGCSFPMVGSEAVRQARSPSASPVSARSKSANLFGVNLDCDALGFFSGAQSNVAAGYRALPLTLFPLMGLGIEPEQERGVSVTLSLQQR